MNRSLSIVFPGVSVVADFFMSSNIDLRTLVYGLITPWNVQFAEIKRYKS